MQWFRFYGKFATDPDVQMMPESYQRRLAMLLCFKCNDDETLQDDKIAFQLRVTPEEWAVTKADFMLRGFIDQGNNILKWNKRQYKSDSSTERVYKHREQKKQPCNVSETPPDTDTDTDTEEPRSKPSRSAHDNSVALIFSGYPRKVGKGRAIPAIKAALVKIERDLDLGEGEACEFLRKSVAEFARSPAGNRGNYTPHCATWMNGERWNDDPAEWHRDSGGTNGNGVSKAQQRQQQTIEAARAVISSYESLDSGGTGEPLDPVGPPVKSRTIEGIRGNARGV